MIRKRKYIVFVVIILAVLYFSPLPSIITFKISLGNIVSYYMGRSRVRSIQYLRYELLKKVTSTADLVKYASTHSNSAVRCYSFLALTEREAAVDYYELIKKNIESDMIFTEKIFKNKFKRKVADFFIGRGIHLLSYSDSLKVDSLLIFTNSELQSKQDLFMNLKPKKEYYNQIRKMALEDKTSAAIISLARYQDKDDLKLIIDYLNDSSSFMYFNLRAVNSFPDSIFIPELLYLQDKLIIKTKNIDYYVLRMLYKSLMKYNDERIGLRMAEIIEYDNSVRKGLFKINGQEVNTDSSNIPHNYNDYTFTKDHEYTLHSHVIAMKIAILDNPNTQFKHLENLMVFSANEKEMIENTYQETKDE